MDTTLHINELKSLIEVSRAVNAHLDLDAVLETVMSVTAKLMRAEASSLILVDEETGDLLFHVAQGEVATEIKPMRMMAGQGIVGHVIRTGEPYMVNDVASCEHFEDDIDEQTGFCTKSVLCVPLQTPNKRFGAIEVLNKLGDKPFDEHDQVLLEAVSSQAAIAIENAMLHRRVVRNERLATVGNTVAGMAHCVKNVLNGLRAGSYILDKGLRKEEVPKIARGWDIVKRNNDFIEHLVLDMLTFSKERQPEYETVEVNDVVKSVCEMISSRAEVDGIKLDWMPGNEVGMARIDPGGIKRCVLNLVSNAMDACREREDPRVTIQTSLAGDQGLSISVRDNGVGIEEKDTAHLFRVFFSTKGSKGTGFGLAVTQKIVSEHKGRIDVVSQPGNGAMFNILLPVSKEGNQCGQESQASD